MKRSLIVVAALVASAGCTAAGQHKPASSPYERPPFYAKYLNTGSMLDLQIQRTLDALRTTPQSPQLHNELGSLLVQKGFPKDAAREFERAIDADGHYFPAWYNLGLVRASLGDDLGARRALYRTIALKPGHSAALFQLGLIEEERKHTDRAVDLYAKAFAINPALLSVEVNPRILDSELTDLAILKLYPRTHTRASMQFQGAPSLIHEPRPAGAPSPQAAAQDVVPPAAPVTDRSMQPVAATVIPVPPAGSDVVTRPSTPTPAPTRPMPQPRRNVRGSRSGQTTTEPAPPPPSPSTATPPPSGTSDSTSTRRPRRTHPTNPPTDPTNPPATSTQPPPAE